jgi:hypothetical protein
MSQSFADRLVAQLILAEQREEELLTETRALAQHAAEKQTLLEKNAALRERMGQLERTRNEYTAANKAARKRLMDVIADDDQQRKVLSEELQEKIQGMNIFAEECAKAHAQKVHEGVTLKEQLAVLAKHKEMGTDKFREITLAREREIDEMQANLSKEISRLPGLTVAYASVQEDLSKARAEHSDLKGQVDGYIAKFNDVQQRLNDARTIYDAAKEERDRMARRLHTVETDRQTAIGRAEKCKTEMLSERVKAEELEKQVALVEKQIAKLQQLYETLTAPKTSGVCASSAGEVATSAASHADPNA